MEITAIVGIVSSEYFKPRTQLRTIVVPNNELLGTWEADSAAIFQYGQNDFQPANAPSLSVGDIVMYNYSFYRVEPIGWTKLTPTLPNHLI